MTLLHFHSHRPFSCKEGIIYSQALCYNMIISEDHILQAELNNVTCILLALAYLLQLIIKNTQKFESWSEAAIACFPIEHHIHTPTFFPLWPLSQTWANNSQPSYTEIDTLLQTTPHSPPSGHPNLFQPTPNPTVFIATLFTLHKHMVPHSKTPRTTTHTYPHTPIRAYPYITTVVPPVFSSILDTSNSSWCHGQGKERQDIPPRFWYYQMSMRHTIAALFTAPYASLARASKSTLFAPGLSPMVPLFPITSSIIYVTAHHTRNL